MSHRNLTVDIAKGIGILLVVFGHNWIVKQDPGELFRIIFSFHVPLFFFMSGFFLKDSDSLKSFIVRRADTLLKPYVVILVLIGILKLIHSFHGSSEPFSVAHYFLGILYATGPTTEGVSLWFLPHLFVASILAMKVLKMTAMLRSRGFWIGIISGLFLLLGIPFIRLFWLLDTRALGPLDRLLFTTHQLPGLPFSLDLIFISSALILLGFLFRNKVKVMRFHFPSFWTALMLFATLHIVFDETIDLNMRLVSHPIVSPLQAILGIYLVLSASAGLQRFSKLSRPLISIGAGSLFILIFHTFVQEKVFILLLRWSHASHLSAIVSFVAAIGVSLWLLNLVKRKRSLSLLLLPYKARLNHLAKQ